MSIPMTNLAGPSSTEAPETKQPATQAPAQPQAPAASAQSPTAQQDAQAVKNVEKAAENNDADFAAKFAALSREQKKLFQERQAIREKEEAFKAKEQRLAEYEKKASLWNQNKLGFLKEEGISLEELVNMAVEEGQPPSLEKKLGTIEQRLEQFYKEREEEKKRAEESQIQSQIDAYKSQIKDTLSKDVEKWEVINEMGLHDHVYELILESFQQTGETMSIEEAADQVENYVVEHAKKLAALKKLQPKVELPPAPLEEKKPEAPKSPLGEIKSAASIPATLTSKAVAEPKPKEPEALLDRDESIRKIARDLQERLNAKKKI